MAISVGVPPIKDVLAATSAISSAASEAAGAITGAANAITGAAGAITGAINGISVSVPPIGDLLKNANAAAGELGALADKFKTDVFAAAKAAEDALPKFSEMMDAAKSGAIFKDTADALSALSSLPGKIDFSAVTAAIDAAKATAATDIAIATAALAQKAKEAQAAGRELTQAEIDAATAPLKVLTEMQAAIGSAVSAATDAVGKVAGDLGAAVSAGVDGIKDAAAAASDFLSKKPADLIKDATGIDIPNPAAIAFLSDPINAAKAAATEFLSSAAESVGAALGGTFSALADAAAAGKADAISSLKADAMLAMLTKPLMAAAQAAVGASVDTSKINVLNIIKAQEGPIPKLPAALAPPRDQLRPGSSDVTRFYDKLNAVDPRPELIYIYELNAHSDEMKENALEFRKRVDKEYSGSEPTVGMAEALKAWGGAEFTKYAGTDGLALKRKAQEIEAAKPDRVNLTEEEAETVKSGNELFAKFKIEHPPAVEIFTELALYNLYKRQYSELFAAWKSGASRFSLSPELLEKISKYKS